MPSWWGWQCRNTLDRATMHLPELLYQRLDEFALDYTILYPSMTLSFLDMLDGELAQVLCRAVNRMHARVFAPYQDRMTVGALVPMPTPDVAITELTFAVEELGLKTAVIAGAARRSIGRIHAADPALDSVAYRLDTYGLDSEYDYDPFWQACLDLGVAPRQPQLGAEPSDHSLDQQLRRTTTSAAWPRCTSRCASRCSSAA